MAKKFRCTVCGYIHEGDKAPAECPVCKQPSSMFEEIADESKPAKKGLNTNSNVYTIVYALILTVLVAVLLTVAAVGLAPQQKANSDNEKKQQILSAVAEKLGKEVTFTNAADIWSELDMDNNTLVVDVNGNTVDANAFSIEPKSLFKGGIVKDDAQLPVFMANIGGNTYYIMCMYGSGLWDAIWGYIAVEADGSTIAGASFDHKGETAGLGAKIKDDPNFAKAFIGKTIFTNGEFAPVVVTKKNVENKVDAITGATKTSDYVGDMIRNSLTGYKAYLLSIQGGEQGQCNKEQKCCGKCKNEGEGQCEGKCKDNAEGCGEGQCEGKCKDNAEGCGEGQCKGEGNCGGDCKNVECNNVVK